MVSTIDFSLEAIHWLGVTMKMGGDRPVTADIDQWKVFMAGGLNKQFWRIEKTIYWGYKSVSDPNCPSPGAKLLQETKHDAKTAGDHMDFSHGIHQVLRFQFLEQWREIPCRLIIMGTWLVMSLCVLSWSIHYWKVTHLSSRIRVKRKDQQLWYDMKWIIYIWLYDIIFPDYFFYFTSVSESGVDLCQLAFFLVRGYFCAQAGLPP